MRSSWKTLVAAVAMALLAPQFASADEVATEEVSAQLDQMQERMSQLEEKLQATTDQLDAAEVRVGEQQRMIEKAGLDDRSAASALSRFLEQTKFSGFVAASYNYNFNQPSDTHLNQEADDHEDLNEQGDSFGVNSGNGFSDLQGVFNPLHSNANSFTLDQLWFSMQKPSTAESRGGFGADIVFGTTGDYLRDIAQAADDDDDEGSNDFTGDLPALYQAYVSYLAPIGDNGILVQAGRYETVIGYETVRQDSNFQITRGILWGTQPVHHTGVKISAECDCGMDWALGISNNAGPTMFDSDNSKTGLAHIGYTGETFGIGINGLLGGDTPDGDGRDSDYIALADIVGTWDPSSDLATWINFDYASYRVNEGPLSNFNVYGVAGGGRFAITENTGFSLRGEWVKFDDIQDTLDLDVSGDPADANLWSITGTIDHALTDNLTVKVEGRYDHVEFEGDSANDDFFISKDGGSFDFSKQDQVLALIELLYRF